MTNKIKVIVGDATSFMVDANTMEVVSLTTYDPPPRELGIKEISFDEWLRYQQDKKKLDDSYAKNLEFNFKKLYDDKYENDKVYEVSITSSRRFRIKDYLSCNDNSDTLLENAKENAKYQLVSNLYRDFLDDIQDAISSLYRDDKINTIKILGSIKTKIRNIGRK